MVRFWPFGGDDTSAAGFEKVLSSLTSKINKISAKEGKLRQSQRRLRVLWTLYTSFAYLAAALILVLVVGHNVWGAIEYSGLAGGPVIIFGVRLIIDAYFNYRISGTQSQLNDLYRQREDAIEKLKNATKYNSTQQLLEKYGGQSPPQSPNPSGGKRKQNSTEKKSQPQVTRTGIPPPPTANIQNRQSFPPQGQQDLTNQAPPSRSSTLPQQDRQQPDSPSAEFAPNAFEPSSRQPTTPSSPTHPVTAAPLEYAPAAIGPKWYDRILDIVLGDDETQPKNRIILICQHCRLVNGQAPPGTRSLDDLGKWKCMACGGMNGRETEVGRMVREIVGPDAAVVNDERDGADGHGRELVDVDEDEEAEAEVTEASPAGSTRSKARQRKGANSSSS